MKFHDTFVPVLKDDCVSSNRLEEFDHISVCKYNHGLGELYELVKLTFVVKFVCFSEWRTIEWLHVESGRHLGSCMDKNVFTGRKRRGVVMHVISNMFNRLLKEIHGYWLDISSTI